MSIDSRLIEKAAIALTNMDRPSTMKPIESLFDLLDPNEPAYRIRQVRAVMNELGIKWTE